MEGTEASLWKERERQNRYRNKTFIKKNSKQPTTMRKKEKSHQYLQYHNQHLQKKRKSIKKKNKKEKKKKIAISDIIRP